MTVALMLGTPKQSYFVNGTTYVADSNGVITSPAPNDVQGLINSGCTFGGKRQQTQNFGIVLAASATRVVANTACSSSGLVIAAQPDVCRPLQGVLAPGTVAVSAGTCSMVYTADDGSTTTDVASLITPLSTSLTFTTSKGVAGAFGATVAAFAGGASPTIQIGTNANLALQTDPGVAGLTFTKADMDDTDVALPAIVSGRIFTPATAPNGTHTYSYGFTFYSP
jgi:hypothetical protein